MIESSRVLGLAHILAKELIAEILEVEYEPNTYEKILAFGSATMPEVENDKLPDLGEDVESVLKGGG